MKRLDLRKDFNDVYAYVVERLRSFDPESNEGPGQAGPVTRIDVGFGLYQSGWVCLVFDTRPDAEPDGEWNEYIEETVLERPHWAQAIDAIEAGPLALVLPDGTQRELPDGASGELVTAISDMLRAVLLKTRADGVFVGLPRAARCELGVEEQDGSYGWPAYEEREQDNLASP
jgi:hypothetical protein